MANSLGGDPAITSNDRGGRSCLHFAIGITCRTGGYLDCAGRVQRRRRFPAREPSGKDISIEVGLPLSSNNFPCPEWRVSQSMVCCFRDGKRLLMGKYIYSQNPPSPPAPPGPERGSVTRSNVKMPMPLEWFWMAVLSPARWLYFKEPRSIGLNQTKSNRFGTRPSPGAAITKPASRSIKPKRGNRFPLSRGERAGVRASVGPYCRQLKANHQISASHHLGALFSPFPGSAWPEISVIHTKSNHFKPGLMNLGNGEAPEPPNRCLPKRLPNFTLVKQTITLK